MFVGHYGLGLGGKRAAPRVSLGTLFLAVQWLDLVWPILLLAGLEHVRLAPGITRVTPLDFYDYPISHSLLGATGWALVVGGVHYARRRAPRAALIVGLLVLSHWVLDFVSHRPDMPIGPTGPYVGLGLWRSLPATLVVELALFGGGLLLYARATFAVDRVGRWALVALVVFLVAIYWGNLLGPPPPSTRAIGWAALGQWLLVAWGYWIDRHRRPRSASSPARVPVSAAP
jgi:hypothetical protein